MLLQMLVANEVLAINIIGGIEDSNELIKKSRKLLKIRKLLKGQKLSKSQKSAKLGKKLSKSGNLPKFDAKKNRLNFLTPKAKTTLDYL